MPRKPSFINADPDEISQLKLFLASAIERQGVAKHSGHRQRRRAQIILFSLQGWTVSHIAREFRISQQTVWKWRRIYQAKGIEGLKGKNRSFGL